MRQSDYQTSPWNNWSNPSVIKLNKWTVKKLWKIAQQANQQKKELAGVLTTEEEFVSIDKAQSQAWQISYTQRDLTQALQDSDAAMSWLQFHTHIQWLNHANVHSHQDEHQHAKNIQQSKKNYSWETFRCLGNGIIWAREDGWFHIKARWANNSLQKFSYQEKIAEELVFDKEGNLIGINTKSTLNPEDNTNASWEFKRLAA